MSTENLTPLSLEIHFRTADHFTEREGPGVSCKEDQTPLSSENQMRTVTQFKKREGPGVSCKEDQTPLFRKSNAYRKAP